MGGRSSGAGRLLVVFGVLLLAAVALGAFVCAQSGVAMGSWLRNLIAWGVGAGLAVGLLFAGGRTLTLSLALLAAPLLLAVSFLNSDQEGVHRWIDAGPLHVNVAMIVLPAAAVALAGLGRERLWPWVAAFVVMALLVAQPDASQALAFAGAAGLVALLTVRKPGLRLGVLAGLAALAAGAWFRPDPLEPVAEAEELVALAFRLSVFAGVGVVTLLAATAAAPTLSLRSSDTAIRAAGWGLSLLLLLWAVAPWLGAFPVPFAGIGMSPIVGGWLGAGLLAGLVRTHRPGRFG